MTQQIQAQQAQMNQMLAAGQNQVNQIVQQKMQDPRVQQAYQQHLAQAQQQGVRPYDFPTFAYYYAATNGFSAAVWPATTSTTQDIQGKERTARQGVKDAEANSAAAINGWNQGYSNNQQEVRPPADGQQHLRERHHRPVRRCCRTPGSATPTTTTRATPTTSTTPASAGSPIRTAAATG